MASAPALKVGVVVFHRRDDGRLRYLLLRRPPQRGGWWGVITGAVEPGESAREAAERETREESGIERFLAVLDMDYIHTFQKGGRTIREPYFAIRVPPDSPVRLSEEHVAYRWATLEEAVPFLHWPHWAHVLRLVEGRASPHL
jgi:lipoyl(octanoyl) transferase